MYARLSPRGTRQYHFNHCNHNRNQLWYKVYSRLSCFPSLHRMSEGTNSNCLGWQHLRTSSTMIPFRYGFKGCPRPNHKSKGSRRYDRDFSETTLSRFHLLERDGWTSCDLLLGSLHQQGGIRPPVERLYLSATWQRPISVVAKKDCLCRKRC